MNSLCNMVNTDLNNISEWSKQWLVKVNPTILLKLTLSILTKKRRGTRMDPWGTPALRLPFPEIAFCIITCCSLAEI
jgi:hypothetical protein